MSFLSIHQLAVQIGNKPLLHNIDLEIVPNQITALLGPNGAGKSSLLKAICGDLAYQHGEVQFHGRSLSHWPQPALAKELGVLPQHNSLTFPFTVSEVVAMGLYPLRVSHSQGVQITLDAMAQVDISHLAERRYPTLSGGEKQRVQLARVLTQLAQASNPLLLLDEPTSALDLAQQHRVLALAQHLTREHNMTVVAVLHDLNQAARYADQLVVLSEGQICAQGSAEQVLNGDLIEHVWHYRPTITADPVIGTPVIL